MPLVSVIIPAFNAAKYVGKAVTSALAQTVTDIEIIVVDDGSTDGTRSVISAISDKRVKYLYQENLERSAARNHGIAVASGAYLAFLDADDWWVPTKLEKQLALFAHNPLLGLAGCWLRPVTPDGEVLPLLKGFLHQGGGNGALVFERLLFGGLPGGSSLVVSREAATESGGFRTDLQYGEDWDFALRISARYHMGYVPEPLVYYRVYGLYMPVKMSRLGQQLAFPKIVMSALHEGGFGADSPLARRALARAYYYGGLVDAGVGDYVAANSRFTRAKELDESRFSGRRPPLVEPTAYFASALYDTVTPLDESLDYIRDLSANLADGFADLKRAMRYALSLACAVRVFQSESSRVNGSVTSAFLQALYYDRSWLRNGRFLRLGALALKGKSKARAERVDLSTAVELDQGTRG
jgi:glycosyltransferase involved in cell wall biosynthesis